MSERPEFNPADFKEGEGEVIPHEPPGNDRSLGRRIALQILYEVDTTDHTSGSVIAIHLQARDVHRRVARYVRRLVDGVVAHQPVLDDTIAKFAPEWPVTQMAVVDRNILRLALYEFALRANVPVGAAIDEAVTLARIYGSDSSMSFINGVLGTIANDTATLEALRLPDETEKDEAE